MSKKRRYRSLISLLIVSIVFNYFTPTIGIVYGNDVVTETDVLEETNQGIELGENLSSDLSSINTEGEKELDSEYENSEQEIVDVENQSENDAEENSGFIHNKIEEIEAQPALDDEEEVINLDYSRATVGTGLVQFMQEIVPGQENLEDWNTTAVKNLKISYNSEKSNLYCKVNHDLISNGNSGNFNNYINSCYVDDAMYLGQDTGHYYILVSGYEGKVEKSKEKTVKADLNRDGIYVEYRVKTVAYFIPAISKYSNDIMEPHEVLDVPSIDSYNQYLSKYSSLNADVTDYARSNSSVVQSPSYYANEQGELVHYITNNVTKYNDYYKIIIGRAPSWMSQGVKYYSYDGIYFYHSWQNIRSNGIGAVNETNPFYNYYQFLPVRSKSNYSASDFEKYTLSSKKGSTGKLVGAGRYFANVQDKFGINGALQYAIGINESDFGTSKITKDKNNIFGIGANDGNPYGDASGYPSIENCINYHAERVLSWAYTDPLSDSRYYGSHLGNKGSGINVKYASDPFWGEKAARWYYSFDKASGLKDYNYYSIGVKNNLSVYNVRSGPTTKSSILYTTKNTKLNHTIKNYPFLIVGQVDNFYKIQTDTPIINGKSWYKGAYDWNLSIGYVDKDAILASSLNNSNYNNPSNNKESYYFFVKQVYNSLLKRDPSQSELSYWGDPLIEKTLSIVEFMRGIIESNEYKVRKTTDTQFIGDIFKALLRRTADESGINYYLTKLNMGLTRDYVLVDVLKSNEFSQIAIANGLVIGNVSYSNVIDSNEKITDYVNNLFQIAFKRKGDISGLTYWVGNLSNKSLSGWDLMRDVYTGPEFRYRVLSDAEFINTVFQGILLRNADQTGSSYWVKQLKNGKSRYHVIKEITQSKEFSEICSYLGIKVN